MKLFDNFKITSFGKDIILSLAYKIIGLLLRFFVQIIIARFLGIDIFGNWKLALSWINIFVIFSILGTKSVIIRTSQREEKGKIRTYLGRVIKQSELIFIGISLLFLVISIISKNEKYASYDFRISYYVAIGFGFFNVLNKLFHSVLTGFYKNYIVTFLNSIILQIVKTILLIVGFYLLDPKILILFGIVLAEIFLFGLTVRFYKKLMKQIDNVQSNEIKCFNIPFLVIDLTKILYITLNIIMISFWCSSAEVGGFSSASVIANLLLIFALAFIPFMPKISNLYANNQIKKIEKQFQTIIVLIGVFTLPISFFPFIYSVNIMKLFGEEFSSYYSVLIILSIGHLVDAVTGPISNLLRMSKYEKLDMYNSFYIIGCNLLLNLFLIPRFGALGAAWGFTVSIIIVTLIKIITVKKILNINTFFIHKNVKLVLVYLVFFSGNLLLSRISDGYIFMLIVLIITYILFVLSSIYLKILDKDDFIILFSTD